MALKRELGLFSTTLYGIGIILGAGVYALLGIGAGLAGNMLWLAFLVSASIAIFTGLSYAELAGMFQKAAAEYNYTKKAFRKEWLSFLIQWIFVIGIMIGASTVALGFAGYFVYTFGGDEHIVAACLIILMSILSYIGIKESASFNNIVSIVEAGGLLIVVAIWLLLPSQAQNNLLEFPAGGWDGIFAAVGVIFFAYIGFENIANLSEDVKDSRKIVPLALVLALGISTVLYMLVSIAAVHMVGWETLAQSKAPLTTVVSTAFGDTGRLFSLIALFATSNTVLVFLIVASRILYGLAKGGSLPRVLTKTSSRGTPHIPIILVCAITILGIFIGDLKTIAQITDMGVFIAYISVNGALIVLAKEKYRRSFQTPRICGVPVLAWLGALTSLFMLTHFEAKIWLIEGLVVLSGIAIYLWYKRARHQIFDNPHPIV